MLVRRTLFILALAALVHLAGGCSREASPEANNAAGDKVNSNRAIEPGMDGAKDNSDELRTLIKLPYEPEDLVWKDYGNAGGQQGRRLLAVLQLSAEDTRKLIDSAAKVRPGTPATIPIEKWFPKELETQSELNSGEGIQVTAYAADEFFQPPFDRGTLSHVNNTDFFVLELFAK